MKISQKLAELRALMSSHAIHAYLIPHGDAHDSEYNAKVDERLAFISGFDGSAGIGLVTEQIAYMWTDSRYFLQAQKQLDDGWELQKIEVGTPTWFEYAKNTLAGKSIGYDPLLMSADLAERRAAALVGISYIPIKENLIDKIWKEKPEEQIKPIIIHESEYHKRSVQEKVEAVFALLKKEAAKKAVQQERLSILLSKLDQIAWVLNLRGFDIDYNPVFKSYLYLAQNEGGILFIDERKVTPQVKDYLNGFNIKVSPYLDVFNHNFQGVYVTKSEINQFLYSTLVDPINVALNPVEALKAVKNERELQGFIDCHVRDGAALVTYLSWLEKELNNGTVINEYDAAMHLDNERKKQPLNMGLSFNTISSAGANAAVVHYHPPEAGSAQIEKEKIYLVDSGGQYQDGTTDVTRTVHFGHPSAEMRNAYTRVLLGNLDIERLQFPKQNKIHGGDIDVLARRWLWASQLDYGHGTGHGVGYFLNVHEGPHGISRGRTHPFEPGMIVSNEPGFYKDGEFGIRIENLIYVENRGDAYFGFKNITLCPYDRNLIDLDLLAPRDVKHINEYHKEVRGKVMPLLTEDFAREWLHRMTEPL